MKAQVALVQRAREAYGPAAALRAVELARSTWYYHTRRRVSYAEKYAHLEGPLKAIAEGAPGVRVPEGHHRAPGDVGVPCEPQGGVERLHRLWD